MSCRRKKHRGEARGDTDQQAAKQRAGEAADAADDDRDEARHEQSRAHRRLQPQLTCSEHAAQAGEKDTDGEIQRAQLADVDAERRNGFQVEGAGTDADPEPAVTQQHEEQRNCDGHGGDHEQAVAGDEEELIAQRVREHIRNGHRLALRAPDESGAILEDERQTECEQQAVKRIASIDTADQRALDDQTDDGGEQRRDQQRAPEADIGRDRVGDVTADDEEAAMGKVDHVAQIEDERQAERHQHIKGTDDEPVGDVEEK
jgi:hypothetical protein